MAYYGVNVTWVDLGLVLAGVALIGAVMAAFVMQLAGGPGRRRREPAVLPQDVAEAIGKTAATKAEDIVDTLGAMIETCEALSGRIGARDQRDLSTTGLVRELDRLKAQMHRIAARATFLPGEAPGGGAENLTLRHLNEAGGLDAEAQIGAGYDDPGAWELAEIEKRLSKLVEEADKALASVSGPALISERPDWVGLAEDLRIYALYLIELGRHDEADKVLRDANAALYRGYRAQRAEIKALQTGSDKLDDA